MEALTLKREDGRFETACNLLQPREVTTAMVLTAATRQAERLGVAIVDDYTTNPTEEETLAIIHGMLGKQLGHQRQTASGEAGHRG